MVLCKIPNIIGIILMILLLEQGRIGTCVDSGIVTLFAIVTLIVLIVGLIPG